MKKIAILLFSIIFILSVTYLPAQKRLGAGLAFGSDIETIGILVNAEIFIKENVSIAPDIIVYLNNTNRVDVFGVVTEFKQKLWEVNGNVHYYFVNQSGLNLYGLAGLNYSNVGVESTFTDPFSGATITTKASDGQIGLNLGGGINFGATGNLLPFVEIKFIVGSTDQAVLAGGVRFDL